MTNYGRVTKYNNVQTSDSGYIECVVSQSFGRGILYRISRSRIEGKSNRSQFNAAYLLTSGT